MYGGAHFVVESVPFQLWGFLFFILYSLLIKILKVLRVPLHPLLLLFKCTIVYLYSCICIVVFRSPRLLRSHCPVRSCRFLSLRYRHARRARKHFKRIFSSLGPSWSPSSCTPTHVFTQQHVVDITPNYIS